MEQKCDSCELNVKNNEKLAQAILTLIEEGKLPPAVYDELVDRICTNAGC